MSRIHKSRGWEVAWRTLAHERPDGPPVLLMRRLSARKARDLKARVPAECAEAFNGELRLTSPEGATIWTSLARIARWTDGDLPEEDGASLWAMEHRRRCSIGAMLAAMERALEIGVRGRVLPGDAVMAVIEHAERLCGPALDPFAPPSSGVVRPAAISRSSPA